MFGSLGYGQSVLSLVLVLIPMYLVYRIYQHVRYTKALEKTLSETARLH